MAIFFEPINITEWDMFERIKGAGHVEGFLAVSEMRVGDIVLLYVGKQNPDIESGVYSYGTIISEPYIYLGNPSEHCHNRLTVDVRINDIVYYDPMMNEEEMKTYIKQFRSTQRIREQYIDEILEKINYSFTPFVENPDSTYRIDEERMAYAIQLLKKNILQLKDQNGEPIRFNNGFFAATEGYKYKVYDRCRKILNFENWSSNMIGTGEISELVLSTFGKGDNLIDFRTNTLEERIRKNIAKSDQVFFDIYCGNDDEKAFENAVSILGKPYDKIAFIFFLKDREKYLPIKPTFFGEYLELYGVSTGCMNGLSWKHLNEFTQIVREVQYRIRPYFDGEISLLDAHSFVWCMYLIKKVMENITIEYEDYFGGQLSLSKDEWKEILEDPDIFKEKDCSLLTQIYLSANQASTCKALAMNEGQEKKKCVSNLCSLAKRIAKTVDFEPPRKANSERMWFPIMFLGRILVDNSYDWKIRHELNEAITDCLSEEITIKQKEKEVQSSSSKQLYQRIKSIPTKPVRGSKTTVASYIRNPAISEYAKRAAKGVCQLCVCDAPFEDKKGKPYLESHHIVPLSEGGADSIENVIALCPNCHKKMHVLGDEDDIEILVSTALEIAEEWEEKFS